MEEDYDEDYDEYEEDDNESEGLILSIGEDGKASIHKPEDYVEMHKDDADIIKGFIEKYKDLFDKYVAENKTQGDSK
jgi:hypothetical protein